MDNVTHSLVGLMIARAGVPRDQKAPALAVVLAANFPDADIVTGLMGSLTYLQYHRSYLHSLLLWPAVAALPLLIVAWRQKITPRLYLLCLIAGLSHLLLDWTNVYGIRMLLPFSSRILRLDITDIVDPWILLLLLAAVAAPALSRMVGSEIRSGPATGPKRGWAWAALILLLSYEGARFEIHDRAVAVMGARMYSGATPRRITAIPMRFNPLEWRGVVETDHFVSIVPVNLAEEFDPGAGKIFYPAPPSPAIEAAKQTRPFQVFGAFSQVPFWKSTPAPEGTFVELIDLRFGTPQEPGFLASAMVDAAGVHDAKFAFGTPPIRSR